MDKDSVLERLLKNQDDIANFLSSANPNWSNSELKDILHKHLEFVTAQVVVRLNKNCNADIEAYDKCEEHMIVFADMQPIYNDL